MGNLDVNILTKGRFIMKIVWVVQIKGQRVLWETFQEAWEDYCSHKYGSGLFSNPSWIYPKLIAKARFDRLKEHNGW
jgi:hypothetical protein